MPVSIPPTNTTPETAFVLNGQVPLDATINLTALPSPQRVWFTYTLEEQDFALATWASGYFLAGVDGFRPLFKYRWNDPLATPYQEGGPHTVEAFIEEAVGVARTGTIYISLENGYVGFTPTLITTLYIQVSINATAPVGSPLINNDIAGYPLTVVSATGEPTQLRSFPAGESAANLENGISLWSDAASTSTLHLYDANLVLIRDVTWPRGHLRAPIASNRIDTFYAATRGVSPGKITTVSQTGVLGTEWTIATPDVYHAAPSWLDSDLIYVYVFDAPHYGISKFHKATSTLDAAAFIDGDDPDYEFRGFYGNEFLVLPDDSVLMMFKGDTDSKVRRYDAAGTFVREFVIPAAEINHLAYDGVTYASFWTWSFTLAAFDSRFIRFRVSDGAILDDFTLPTTSSGEGISSDPTSVTALFGVPECCPFLTTPVPLPPYGGPTPAPGPYPPEVAPSYHLDARYIRRLRRAPHVANENKRTFYRSFELDLERGVGLATGQGSDPIVLLRLSRDGGHTWGEELRMSAGALGAYTQRAVARRLGAARDTVFEVTVSDPVAWSLVQAWLDLEAGTS